MKRLLLLFSAALSMFGQGAFFGQSQCNGQPATGTGWTSATSVNTTQTLISNVIGSTVLVTLDQTTTITGGAVQFQGDPGDGNVVNLNAWQVVDPTTPPFATISQPYTLVASTNKQFAVNMSGYYKLILKLTTAITGSATVTPYTTVACYAMPLLFQATNTNMNVSATFPSAQSVTQSSGPWTQNVTQFGGNAVATGTGVGGNGVPRVTVSSDSSLAANQSVNVNQIGGASTGATNPLYAAIADGTNGPAAVKAASTQSAAADKSLVIQLNPNQPNLTTALNVALAANQSVNTAQVGGSSVSTAATGVQKVGVVGNSGAAVDAATGAAPPANALYIAGLKSGATGGFLGGITVCDLDYVVNVATATTVEVAAGVSGRLVHICSIDLIAGAADNVAVIEGTGATCTGGTTAGLTGGTTAASGWNFSANGGIALGSGLGEVMASANTGNNVCIITSASAQLSGHVKYTIF